MGDDVPSPFAHEGAVDALHRQRLVVVAVGNLLVLAVQSHHLFFQLAKRLVLFLRWSDGVISCVDA